MSDEEEMMNLAGPSVRSSAPKPPLPPGMSKNAMKKAARIARNQETKTERRAVERAKRKERDLALREGYAAGTLTEEEKAIVDRRRALKIARKSDWTKKSDEWKGGIIIDLEFDELMTDQEISSMASQLGFVYSANRTAPRPIKTILHTSFGPTASPRLWKTMATRGWPSWKTAYFREQSIDEVAREFGRPVDVESSDSAAEENELRGGGDQPVGETQTEGRDHADLLKHLQGPVIPSTLSPSQTIVYLSADADEELETLSENEVYVIGGVVDRNRHKMMCQNKAQRLGMRTARLPIGKYLHLTTRQVLTVNQVFEILVQYIARNDWAAAFQAAIPQRKYDAVLGKKGSDNKVQAEVSDEEEKVTETGVVSVTGAVEDEHAGSDQSEVEGKM